jgi:hypothetical protein
MASKSRKSGSFEDFDLLVEQLARIPVVRPEAALRKEGRRIGSNPAAHNRALLGEPMAKEENARAAG